MADPTSGPQATTFVPADSRPAVGECFGVPQVVYRHSPDVLFTTAEDEAVLLHLVSGMYYSLNRIGTVVWTLLAQGLPLDDIVAALGARFDVTADEARGDVAALVNHLCREKLLVAQS